METLETLLQDKVELLQQLQLVGEELRVLSHNLLEINRHTNEAYQRHATWLLTFTEKEKEKINGRGDDRDSGGDI